MEEEETMWLSGLRMGRNGHGGEESTNDGTKSEMSGA
jgi:hypothetical protein